MRVHSVISIVVLTVSLSAHSGVACAQNFDDRWSIIPKAQAEPAPEAAKPSTPPPPDSGDHQVKQSFSGEASFYSYKSGKTASGAAFDRDTPTAAHRTLPFGTRVRVTDLSNEKSVIVTITDRGPYKRGRVLDLSRAAAVALGITDQGVVKVRADVL